jgi:two-component sensor histidine kinase
MSRSKITAANQASLLAELSSSFDHSPWAVSELSGETHIVRYANSAFCQLIDKPREEVIGRPLDLLLPPADACLTRLDRVFQTGIAGSYTTDLDAAPFPLLFSYNLWPVMAGGRTAGVMIQVNETGPLHETRQAISQALLLGALRQDELIEAADLANLRLQSEILEREQRENDAQLLTMEVSHRVKNNLQIIVALLANEIRRTPAPWEQGYRAMQGRIIAIARLYDLMSQSSRGRTVDLKAFLEEIAATMSTISPGDKPGIRVAVEAQPLELDSERAVPFGLIVNELCANAVKHAFPDGIGLVTLAIRRVENDIELRVTDDGIGMKAPGPGSTPGRHGSDYVDIFVRQLQGALVRSLATAAGTTVNIRFPFLSGSETSQVR